jgi:hypothetical protein
MYYVAVLSTNIFHFILQVQIYWCYLFYIYWLFKDIDLRLCYKKDQIGPCYAYCLSNFVSQICISLLHHDGVQICLSMLAVVQVSLVGEKKQ